MKPPSSLTAVFLLLGLLGLSVFLAKILATAETPPWRADTKNEATQTQALTQNVAEETEFQPFTFISFNVKNWLTTSKGRTKKPEAKAEVIRILSENSPDIIGLSEIGNEEDAREIQAMLKANGCDLPYLHHSGGSDAVRHLVLLSRFPITTTLDPDLKIAGTEISMRRGILDTTVKTGREEIRFIGLHLKSKRSVPNYDQSLLRLQEATHTRQYIDKILTENPDENLVVYGDFNDSTGSLSTKTIFGRYQTPGYMSPLHVKDFRGESWTHFYEPEDAYTRIDFVTVSKNLKPFVDKKNSKICDDLNWNEASDHRAILIRFR